MTCSLCDRRDKPRQWYGLILRNRQMGRKVGKLTVCYRIYISVCVCVCVYEEMEKTHYQQGKPKATKHMHINSETGGDQLPIVHLKMLGS